MVRKLDRLARSLPDARDILDELTKAQREAQPRRLDPTTPPIRGPAAVPFAVRWSRLCWWCPDSRPAADTRSDGDWQPAQSGLITGGGADLLCGGRRAGPAILMRLALTSRRVTATTPFEADACRRSSLRAVSRPRRSRTRSRAGKATVRPASSLVRCCSASAATAARVR